MPSVKNLAKNADIAKTPSNLVRGRISTSISTSRVRFNLAEEPKESAYSPKRSEDYSHVSLYPLTS